MRRLVHGLLVAISLLATHGWAVTGEIASALHDGHTIDSTACPDCSDCAQCDCCTSLAPAILPAVHAACTLEPKTSVVARAARAMRPLTAADIFHPPRA